MKEIERKFILNDNIDLERFSSVKIEQGYISFDPEQRIRRKGDSYFYTRKSIGGLEREEIEIKITKLTYCCYANQVISNMISKRRYNIPLSNQHVAEADIYSGYLKGLKIVEVEFRSVEDAQAFVKPNWFGEEVTDDQRFKNRYLSKLDSADDLIHEYKMKRLIKK